MDEYNVIWSNVGILQTSVTEVVSFKEPKKQELGLSTFLPGRLHV
jgi:hypothetical protein